MIQSWTKSITLVTLLLMLCFTQGWAEAKRMGGGKNIGRSTQSQQQHTPKKQEASPAEKGSGSKWGGVLGGALAGLGLGMLFSHLGIGGGLAGGLGNIILIAAAVALCFWLLRRFRTKPHAPNLAYAAHTPYEHARQEKAMLPSSTSSLHAEESFEKNFDTADFLRQAKVYFVRLQASWDAGNINDLREFTTPEMFAELQVDLHQRTGANKTEVLHLEAELLHLARESHQDLASVRFSGMLRENENTAAESFSEIWHLSRRESEGWLLAGIQQHHA